MKIDLVPAGISYYFKNVEIFLDFMRHFAYFEMEKVIFLIGIGMCHWPYLILLRTLNPLENKQALTVKGILLFKTQNDY